MRANYDFPCLLPDRFHRRHGASLPVVCGRAMTTLLINSDESLQSTFGAIRELYFKHRYVRLNAKAGTDRSVPQNNITHHWYSQIARELQEDDAAGWKAFSKLHFGVPILRAEDEEFRKFYDCAIKSSLSYEEKLDAMKFVPVTSRMTVPQLSKYADDVQRHFLTRSVILTYPVSA